MSRAIAVAKSLIEFERIVSPKVRRQIRSGDKDKGSKDEADGKPAHCRDKSKKATKEKGKDYEKKPRGYYFYDDPHKVRECPMRNRLAAIVRAKEESERESSDDDRHQGEPMRLGAIQVRDGHHEEQSKRVLRLGALRLCQKSSRVEKERTKNVAERCHDASVEAQPDPSQVSAQRTTRKKRKMRRQCKTKGPLSEGARRSHTKCRVGSKVGTWRRRNRRTRVEQVPHTPNNKGIARLSGGGCHGRHARTRSGAMWEVSKGPRMMASRLDRQKNRGQGVGCKIEFMSRIRVNKSRVAYRDVRDREMARSHDG